MGLFGRAIELVLRHEGGYVKNPRDPGGETKYGISKRSHAKLDIANLTVAQAQEIYLREYWIEYGFDRIRNETIAVKLFDIAVNVGPARAIRWIQQALVAESWTLPLVNGALDEQTVTGLESCSPERILMRFLRFAWGHYRKLSARTPEFAEGWMRRLWDIG